MKKRVLVTGATGFLGRHLLPLAQKKYASADVVGVSSKDYDLMHSGPAEKMFLDLQPEIVIHLAAYSGGIGISRVVPADFYYRNTLLTAQVFQQAALHKAKRLVYTMGGCSYPATARSPIDEDQMWHGYPQKESAGYSTAKMMGLVASESYRTQYGLNSIVLIPGNMYGEYDNYRNNESHVVPAMIRRFYEAKLNNAPEVVMWGTGTPTRDFVHAGDVAKCLLALIEREDLHGPINISNGQSTPIKELCARIAQLTGYRGQIRWDTSKPDGQMVKIFDVTRLNSLGLKCDTSLEAGLEKTIRWFSANYAGKGDGLRL